MGNTKGEECVPNDTKKSLAKSLLRLLQNKPINRITIQEITDDCKVNRQTFYYHFENVYDLLKWAITTQLQLFVPDSQNWSSGFTFILSSIKENHAVMLNSMRLESREYISSFLIEQTRTKLITPEVRSIAKGHQVSEEQIAFISDFYSMAFTGIIAEWVRSDMRDPIDKVVQKTRTVVEGSIVAAINRFEIQNRQGDAFSSILK